MARRRRFVTQGAEPQTQGGSGLFGVRKVKKPEPENKTPEPVPQAAAVNAETQKADTVRTVEMPPAVNAPADPVRVEVAAGPFEPKVEVRVESIRRMEEKHALDMAAAVKSAEQKHGREMKQAQDYINGMRGIIEGLKRELAEQSTKTANAKDERAKALETRIARLNEKVVRLEYERHGAVEKAPAARKATVAWNSGTPPHSGWVQVAVRRQGTEGVITLPGAFDGSSGMWMVPWGGNTRGTMTYCQGGWEIVGWREMELHEGA